MKSPEDTMTLQQIAKDPCIVRNTAGKKGRTTAVAPGTAASRYLHYGRIILDAGDTPIGFATGQMETGLIGLKGTATVKTGDQMFTIGRYDSLYVPPGASVDVAPGSDGCDLAEIAAPVDHTT